MFFGQLRIHLHSNGVSLHELAISLSKGRKYSSEDNDDLCIICWDGGNLLLCDGCLRAFHKECASLSSIPLGDWYCKFCQNMFQREKFAFCIDCHLCLCFHESAMFFGQLRIHLHSNGVSLHELAISLSKGRKYSSEDNDDLCIICWDGGNLLLCDGCLRAFHKVNLLCCTKNFYSGITYLNVHLYQAFHLGTGTLRIHLHSNGVSLHELAISLSKGRKYSSEDNDDLCIICWDGGNLLLCDGCLRAFHKECASLSSIPLGDWYCKFCQNMFQREKFVAHNANAVAAGRIEGVDPIEQITKRCIRIVKDIEAELSGCALCRGYDFSKSGFGPRTIILCDQCEKEYHVGCLRDHKMQYLKELPEGDWFCCTDCNRIHSTLRKFLIRGTEKLPDSLVDVIKTKREENSLQSFYDIDVRWRLLNGKFASPETRPLLSEVVSIFHECFDPIVDSTSGRDLIPAMVYGRNAKYNRQYHDFITHLVPIAETTRAQDPSICNNTPQARSLHNNVSNCQN
ncbi:hypothetical protein K1719_021837 [Acacia pycnantha]|nr:hypothetical protein K1719_021837 [Acacia pycnantha]